MSEATVRRATLDDRDALVRMRLTLLRAIGAADADDDAVLAAAIGDYVAAELPAGRFLAWVGVADDGEVIACGGLVYVRKPPSPASVSGREAYIMNMYTVPDWRGRGVASRIFAAILAEVRAAGVDLLRLHATEDGRALYARAGFRPLDTEMVLWRHR